MATQKILNTIFNTIVLKASGGDVVLTLASLANTKARQSAVIDFGANFGASISVMVEIETGSVAPAVDQSFPIYHAESNDGVKFAAGASGTDSAYKDGEEEEWLTAQATLIDALGTTNDATTVLRQMMTFTPRARYGAIIVLNLSGQTTETDNNEHQITLSQIVPDVQAAA